MLSSHLPFPLTAEEALISCQFCGQPFAKSALQQHQVSGETATREVEGAGLFEDEHREFEDGRRCSRVLSARVCSLLYAVCMCYVCVCVSECVCACVRVCCVGELIGIPVYSIRVVSDCETTRDSNKLFLLPFLVFVTLHV